MRAICDKCSFDTQNSVCLGSSLSMKPLRRFRTFCHPGAHLDIKDSNYKILISPSDENHIIEILFSFLWCNSRRFNKFCCRLLFDLFSRCAQNDILAGPIFTSGPSSGRRVQFVQVIDCCTYRRSKTKKTTNKKDNKTSQTVLLSQNRGSP